MKRNLIYTLIFLSISLLSIIAIFLFSFNYSKIYQTPSVTNGVLDYKGYSPSDHKVNTNLAGEWKFYYNQWIVTDEIDNINEKEAHYINVPCPWTTNKYDHKRLSPKGYASYAIKIKNLPVGTFLSITLLNFDGTFNAYINKQLVASCGEHSKSDDKRIISGRSYHIKYYEVTSNSDLDLVIELGYSEIGGLVAAPWLAIKGNDNPIGSTIRYVSAILLGIIVSNIVVCVIITLAFFRIDKDYTIFILLISIVAYFLLSKDVFLFISQQNIGVNYHIIKNASFYVAQILLLSLIYHFNYKKIIRINKVDIIIMSVIAIISNILHLFFVGYLWANIIILFSIISLNYFLYKISISKHKYKLIYMIIFFICFFLIMTSFVDHYGLIVFGTEGIVTGIIITLLFVINILYYLMINNASKEMLKKIRLENEIMGVREQSLRHQIGPHFIFNTLTHIQYLYHENTEQGDEMIEGFSKYLRYYVDSLHKNLVIFSDELMNISEYFDLINTRYHNKLQLLFDIEAEDFYFLIMGLQPLVENAIKYSGITEKEEGYIQICSRQEKDIIEIKVIDNGNGFDTSILNNKKGGIYNVKMRLEYLLNAQLEILSSNEGTEIIITFVKKEGDE